MGAQHPGFEAFKFRRDVALHAFQRLAADVVGGRGIATAAAEFDVVAVNPVVAHFERAYAGSLAFASLEIEQIGVGVAGQGAQFIQRSVVARGNHAAIAGGQRRLFHHRAFQQAQHGREGGTARHQGGQQGRPLGRQAGGNGWQHAQGLAQSRQVARAGRAERDAGGNALEVGNVMQLLAQCAQHQGVQQNVDRLQALAEHGMAATGVLQPAAEQPAAHRRSSGVHQGDEAVPLVAIRPDCNLQMPAGGRIKHDGLAQLLDFRCL